LTFPESLRTIPTNRICEFLPPRACHPPGTYGGDSARGRRSPAAACERKGEQRQESQADLLPSNTLTIWPRVGYSL